MAKVAFIGLGVMGFPMAGHLVQKGGGSETLCKALVCMSVACQSKQTSPVSALPSPSDGCSFALNRGTPSWACANPKDLRS